MPLTARGAEQLLEYINGELLGSSGRVATEDTPLFDDGWIDSLHVLKLIAWIEVAMGRNIPDDQVVMKNFRNVRTIVEQFLHR
jgi:acyl carrier protein